MTHFSFTFSTFLQKTKWGGGKPDLTSYLTMLFLFVFSNSFTQTFTTYFEDWTQSGGKQTTQVQNEFLKRIASITDANSNLYIASASFNESTMVHDLLINKHNHKGSLIWSQQFNITNGGDILVGNITLDGNNNLLFTGAVDNGVNSYDALTVKFSATGTLLWNQIWNGAANGYDGCSALVSDAAGNVYVTGVATQNTVSRDFLTLAYSSSGSLLWSQLYDEAGLVDVAAKIGFSGGNLIVTGAVQNSSSGWAMGFVRYNHSTGVELGNGIISESIAFDEINGFTTDVSGHIYITGARMDNATGLDFITLKIDSDMNVLWEAVYNYDGDEDVAKAVAIDASGNVYVTGYGTKYGKDYLTLKYNSSGALQWLRTYDGGQALEDAATDIAVDDAGNSFVTGYSQLNGTFDYYTIWYDTNGTKLWSEHFNSAYNRLDKAAVIRLDEAGDLLVTGKAVELDAQGGESAITTTVKYVKREIVIPPDEEEPSNAISFVKNNGQLIDDSGNSINEVKYYSNNKSPLFFFSDDKVSFVLSAIDTALAGSDTLHRVDMSFRGSKENLSILSFGKLSQYSNFFLSHIPEGRTRVPHYERLIHNPYSSIDVQYFTNRSGRKIYFVIKPGGNPADIQLDFIGQNGLSLSGAGDLVISTDLEDIVLPKADAYQIDSQGNAISLNWEPAYSIDGNKVSFSIGTYDAQNPLIIRIKRENPTPDSYLSCEEDWVTYYGAGDNDTGKDIKVNGGDIYILSETSSDPFPGVIGSVVFPNLSGSSDAIVGKFDGNGSPIYATYFGGGNEENPSELAINSMGDIYIVGTTRSSNMPIKPPNNSGLNGISDGFSCRISNGGTELKWASYLGGNADDSANSIVIDSDDDVFIVGSTTSNADFPVKTKSMAYNQSSFNTSSNNPDGFILEFDSNNSQTWGSYFAGQLKELFVDAAINQNGDIFILGETTTAISLSQAPPCAVPSSGELPTCVEPSAFNQTYGGGLGEKSDMMIVQFGNDGILKWCTYIGGSDNENVGFVLDLDIRRGAIATSPTNPDLVAIVGYSNNIGAFQHHQQGASPDAYVQQNVQFSPFIVLFENREIAWSSGFSCGTPQPAAEPNRLVFGLGNTLYLIGSTSCSSPESDPVLFCKVPLGNNFPICPPDDNVFFQDDDVNDCTVTEAEHRGAGELFIAGFNPLNELIYSTYFGGIGSERNFGVDFQGDFLFMTGFTNSQEKFPLLNPGNGAYFEPTAFSFQDGFIARLNMEDAFLVETTEVEKHEQATVYPNPSYPGIATISLPGKSTKSNLLVSILDASGKLVQQSKELVYEDSFSLNLSDLKAGFYIIQVISKEKVYSVKLILQ